MTLKMFVRFKAFVEFVFFEDFNHHYTPWSQEKAQTERLEVPQERLEILKKIPEISEKFSCVKKSVV